MDDGAAADPALMGLGSAPAAARLVAELGAIERPQVVELGTLRSDPDFPTHHTSWAPHGEWTKVDREAGTDVDQVDDAHTLATFWDDAVHGMSLTTHRRRREFDAYVACSVYEHLERPWLAMRSAAEVVRPGGWVYVQTHQTFPIHGYPSDFWRFTTGALRVIMEDAGLEVVHAGYLYRCTIEPPPEVTRWNRAPDVESWLNVEALARRPEE